MKHAYVLTESQRMAICALIVDYRMLSDVPQEFIDCSVDPSVTTTPDELLTLFLQVGHGIRSAPARKVTP